jgi:hypothetical protein
VWRKVVCAYRLEEDAEKAPLRLLLLVGTVGHLLLAVSLAVVALKSLLEPL